MLLDREWIRKAIPHQGAMCLLDEVVSWDDTRITCTSTGHGQADHPLRSQGVLGIACGIEYAAQAMAVHGALSAGASLLPEGPRAGATAPSTAGFLVGLRSVKFYALRLDDVEGTLFCHATRVAGDAGTALYDFRVRSAGGDLLQGRATVVLEAKERIST